MTRCRSLAELACKTLQIMLPSSLEAWGRAITSETASIHDDARALRFVLHAMIGLAPRALIARAYQFFSLLFYSKTYETTGKDVMPHNSNAFGSTLILAIGCAVASVVLGLLYMGAAGAPLRYLLTNAAALLVGLTILILSRSLVHWGPNLSAALFIGTGGILLTTAFLGVGVDGINRWVRIAGLAIQPSLILLPAAVVAYARQQDKLRTLTMVSVSVALAMQPDKAMAGALVVGLAALIAANPNRLVAASLLASLASFVVTLMLPDSLPETRYVDQIFEDSFSISPFVGLSVLVGAALLIMPAIIGWLYQPEGRRIHLTFAATWLAIIVAAGIGNYPTPMIGYGGSAIVGYFLSLLVISSNTKSTLPSTASEKHNTVTAS